MRPLSFNLFDIAYSGLKSFGDDPVSNLAALFTGQRKRLFLLTDESFGDMEACRRPAVAADPILKSLDRKSVV